MTLVTTAFQRAAQLRAKAKAMPDHRLVLVSHPMASKSPQQVTEAVQEAFPRIVVGLLDPGGQIPGRVRSYG